MSVPSTTIRMALAGNPNAGKTTLFNALTGARQHVGNYPGITVERKVGTSREGTSIINVTDLPGTYSLTAYTQEELVARDVLVSERPDVVVDVLNASILERNLYLAVQLLELGVPLVLALNMIDEAEQQGLAIDGEKLSRLLGVPVVKTVARSGRGVHELQRAVVERAAASGEPWRPLTISYGPDLDPLLDEMAALIESDSFHTDTYPARWVALKYLEGDEEIRAKGEGTPTGEKLAAMVKKVADHCRVTLGTYPEALIADYRYGFISSILKQGVVQKSRPDRMAVSDRMDQVLTHKLFGPAIMVSVLYFVYQITFIVGDIPVSLLGNFFAWLGGAVESLMPEGPLRSLLVSGVIDGVGGVLSFVPLIMIIFLIISFLEDSGYMARIAYMLDRVFRIFGLHGCSVMPFIVSGGIAGGCAVPGIMAARTLRSPKEKLATILTAPFMTCGAKLPVFILLVAVFFPSNQALALFWITLGAWAAALLVAKVLRSTIIRGEATPFVMELPPYRLPTLRGMAIHTWERTWQYIKKAGTVILAFSILLWAAMSYPGLPEAERQAFESRIAHLEQRLEQAPSDEHAALEAQLVGLENEQSKTELKNSIAGRLGTGLEAVTQYAGFEWRTNIALVGGFAAKEVIISTLGTAYSLGEAGNEDLSLVRRLSMDSHWTMARGVSVILFIMLYAPCFVAVVTIRQESGSWKWAVFSMVFNTLLALAVSVAVFQVGSAF